MATAIDFKALLAAERNRAREARNGKGKRPASTDGTGIEQKNGRLPTNTAVGRSDDLCMGWLAFPDREVYLEPKSPVELRDYAIDQSSVSGIYYIPDFVTQKEAHDLADRITEMPETSWAKLKRRRLQNHGGTPHPHGMVPQPVPRFISQVMEATVEAGIFPANEGPNHVLLNEYSRGQGIAPHQDGPLYQPLVAILSLAGPCVLKFWSSLPGTMSDEPAAASVLCLPNSLLVFSEDAYLTHWHGIDELTGDLLDSSLINLYLVNKSAAVQSIIAENGHLAHGKTVPRASKRLSLTIRRVIKVNDVEKELETPAAREEDRRKQAWWLQSRGEEATLS